MLPSIEPIHAGEVTLRVLIVAGARSLREGLARALAEEHGMTLADASPGREASALLAAARPDLVLADAAIVRATDLPARAAEAGAGLVAFAVAEEDEEEILACAEAGVAGIVALDASIADVAAALKAAAEGEVRCSPRVAALLMRRVASLAATRPPEQRRAPLTRREREIGACVARGLSNKEIATELGIETATVKNHVHNLLEKLRLRRRGEVAPALEGGPGAARDRPARGDTPSPTSRSA